MDSDVTRARFLRAISHDMRQPMQALILYLAALERRVGEGEARAVLSKADRAAQSLVAMFDNLIVLARIEAGKIEPMADRIPLQDLFDAAVVQESRATADMTSLYVKSDEALLGQILHQLVSNAVRHGGGAARLSAKESGDLVEICVSDAGAGIAPEHHARVFEEFARLEEASPEGLGLGLTIARRLSDLLGHNIELRSAPGRGATLIVRAQRA